MKRSFGVMMVMVALTGLLVVGCKNDDGTGPSDQAPAGVSNEVQAMTYYSSNDAFVLNDEQTIADQSLETMNYGTFGKIDANITPIRWGRFVTNITKNLTTNVLPGDSLAVTTIEKTVIGTFKIKGKTPAGDTVTITKPFTDKSTRNMIFRRVNRDQKRFWMNWVPVASSLVDGGTLPPNDKINITALAMLRMNGDTLVSVKDPNTYYLRYRWLRLFQGGRTDTPELVPGEMVKLIATVVSASPDTDVVVLRYGFDATHRRRNQLTMISEKTDGALFTRQYAITWPVHFHRGFFHAGVEAMTSGTLFDDNPDTYSVSWWGVPYRVF
jgi:hypothetical protein